MVRVIGYDKTLYTAAARKAAAALCAAAVNQQGFILPRPNVAAALPLAAETRAQGAFAARDEQHPRKQDEECEREGDNQN